MFSKKKIKEYALSKKESLRKKTVAAADAARTRPYAAARERTSNTLSNINALKRQAVAKLVAAAPHEGSKRAVAFFTEVAEDFVDRKLDELAAAQRAKASTVFYNVNDYLEDFGAQEISKFQKFLARTNRIAPDKVAKPIAAKDRYQTVRTVSSFAKRQKDKEQTEAELEFRKALGRLSEFTRIKKK